MSAAPRDPKSVIERRIRAAEAGLVGLSHRVHAHPELAFEEVRASAWVAEELSEAGFDVEHGCYGLPTAVRASVGSGPLHIAVCAEYDALPGIGHACGHNVIAAAAVGAGLGLAGLADDLGLTVTVLGTPAEEGGGGKALMLGRGAFDGLDAAMMVHPAAVEMTAMPGSAVSMFDVSYRGTPAHAGAYPEQGVNAADAMTVAQVAIGLMRQQTTGTDRVQGIVTEAGSAANVIPDASRGRWIVRTDALEALAPLTARVRRCFEAGALATGCELSITPAGPDYADLRPDPGLLALYRANAEALGRTFPDLPGGAAVGAATDMGNVSHVVPAIHPMLGLDCAPAVNHQPEFTAACVTPAADRAVTDGALAMAWTAADLAARTEPAHA
ncbi:MULTISPECIES: amidohydrolase [unclassified Streptomyces]|uniref:amidohydrolase n=1 Tax=unclassified Streptomyces TaxID=2593676 RepID=UPI002DD999E2|nr:MULTISPECIES: amidohydrolase [unclassified Streptomyces]WSA90786.1 amidohydrolase [Streptomyces sp. NBC_01795]WSB75108.1 amidohydrolase [Streptomyces sp. NBC_01775]WSS16609.1 amidohydrolase [Streptomyces sp. NBC_01186]WSS45427.1 amidohydrolase [Streptomyces sp. NBC_01187]